MSDRLPPNSEEFEKALLGCFLLPNGREQLWEFESSHKDGERYFYDLRKANVFKAIYDLAHAGKPVDLIAVCAELQKRGQMKQEDTAELSSFLDATPSAHNMSYYADELRGLYQKREVIRAGVSIAQKGWELDGPAAIEFSQREIMAIDTEAGDTDSATVKDLAQGLIAEIEDAHRNE